VMRGCRRPTPIVVKVFPAGERREVHGVRCWDVGMARMFSCLLMKRADRLEERGLASNASGGSGGARTSVHASEENDDNRDCDGGQGGQARGLEGGGQAGHEDAAIRELLVLQEEVLAPVLSARSRARSNVPRRRLKFTADDLSMLLTEQRLPLEVALSLSLPVYMKSNRHYSRKHSRSRAGGWGLGWNALAMHLRSC
jgi:hypothetical protein